MIYKPPNWWRTTSNARANTPLHQVFANARSSAKSRLRKNKVKITLPTTAKGQDDQAKTESESGET